MLEQNALYQQIYEVTKQIPLGMVATYGDIAQIVGGSCDARLVGNAMAELGKQTDVPWHRVLAKGGVISTRGLQQRHLLEQEGVRFNAQQRVIMVAHHWPGPDATWAQEHGYATLPPHNDTEQLSLFD
jgi:methylated-DNA-protein-cysteine methyltransferase-like protein